MLSYCGLALFYATPLLPFFETQEITPHSLKTGIDVAGVLLLLSVIVCLRLTPDAVRSETVQSSPAQVPAAKPVDSGVADTSSLWQWLSKKLSTARSSLHFITGNKPYLIFISAFLLFTMAGAFWGALIFIFVDIYLGQGEAFSKMFLLAIVVGIFAVPFWKKMTDYMGKKTIWVLAVVCVFASMVYTGWQTPESATTESLVTIKILQTLGLSCVGGIVMSMLGDIIDYSRWKFGVDRTAIYFSFQTLVQKISGGVMASVAFGIAGWYGFDAAASVQTEEAITGLVLVISWIPSVFCVFTLVCIAFLPIDARRHGIVQRRLDRAASRLSALSVGKKIPSQGDNEPRVSFSPLLQSKD
jgi:Na+/melibiose symporter-like transporter